MNRVLAFFVILEVCVIAFGCPHPQPQPPTPDADAAPPPDASTSCKDAQDVLLNLGCPEGKDPKFFEVCEKTDAVIPIDKTCIITATSKEALKKCNPVVRCGDK